LLRRIGLLVLVLGSFGLGGCTDVISRPELAGYKLAIPTFQNKTGQPNLENQLTQEFNQDFLADGEIEIADVKSANLILEGSVISYKLVPLLMDVHNTPQQYSMHVVLGLALKDVKTGKNRWVEDKFEDSTTYYVANNLNVPPETEQSAVGRLAQQLSRRLITRVLDGL
jgi:hypothetical protein